MVLLAESGVSSKGDASGTSGLSDPVQQLENCSSGLGPLLLENSGPNSNLLARLHHKNSWDYVSRQGSQVQEENAAQLDQTSPSKHCFCLLLGIRTPDQLPENLHTLIAFSGRRGRLRSRARHS